MQENIKKILGSGTTTPTVSNDEMEDMMKIVKSLEDSELLLLKGVSKKIQNEAEEQKGGFLSMLFGTLGARLLGNMLTGKGITRAGYALDKLKKEKGVIRAGYGSKVLLIKNF